MCIFTKVIQHQNCAQQIITKDRSFVNYSLECVAGFSRKIIFNGGVHFTLKEFLDEGNCRAWAKKALHSLINIVWCGFWVGGVISAFLFQICCCCLWKATSAANRRFFCFKAFVNGIQPGSLTSLFFILAIDSTTGLLLDPNLFSSWTFHLYHFEKVF